MVCVLMYKCGVHAACEFCVFCVYVAWISLCGVCMENKWSLVCMYGIYVVCGVHVMSVYEVYGEGVACV